MILLLQRVLEASVKVDEKVIGEIDQGLLILVGIEEEDTQEDIDWLSRKAVNLRIFNDEEGVMNKSVLDVNGDILMISQFTLHASTKKGNRPSYIKAAKPYVAIPIYQSLIKKVTQELGKPIQTGEFGADMKVSLINDGPVTIWIDSKNRI
ncbi:D-aminoacyl-tRNA deacylase [Reichenbachiella versicolor]|uniref:D-aminoacyl-tRNA deacylase n=1 Tax=Reichenbachiella versicolor TaxID=1821036 RepID=UPI000D6E6544|nr:D-aminoacyl-tRNA deacylase [Reichenbachiella versicolor]